MDVRASSLSATSYFHSLLAEEQNPFHDTEVHFPRLRIYASRVLFIGTLFLSRMECAS